MQDSELITRARRGDDAAWVEIVRLHQEPMFRLAFLLLGDPDEAQDATQDALIRAHKHLHRFDAQRALRPWLLSIVANLSRNRQRALGRYVQAMQRWVQARKAPAESVPSLVQSRIKDQNLWKAMKMLALKDQEIIYLRYFLDFDVKESAQVLGVAPGTVKSRTSRALARLHEILREHFPDIAKEPFDGR